jgi:hypothetical protein
MCVCVCVGHAYDGLVHGHGALSLFLSVCVPYVWADLLQANVMLEYTLEEAHALLTRNGENARTNLRTLDEDLAFLRDQIVTTEVSIRRACSPSRMRRHRQRHTYRQSERGAQVRVWLERRRVRVC